MKPKRPDNAPDLFHSQLSQILNMDHKLVRLANRINWDNLASKVEVVYHNRSGQPPLPTRLLVGLYYSKALFNESDENVVERWIENPYWQYFCGFEYSSWQTRFRTTEPLCARSANEMSEARVSQAQDLLRARGSRHSSQMPCAG